MATKHKFRDTDMQAVLGWVLRIGVIVSISIVFFWRGSLPVPAWQRNAEPHQIYRHPRLYKAKWNCTRHTRFQGKVNYPVGHYPADRHTYIKDSIFHHWFYFGKRPPICFHQPAGAVHHIHQLHRWAYRLISKKHFTICIVYISTGLYDHHATAPCTFISSAKCWIRPRR